MNTDTPTVCTPEELDALRAAAKEACVMLWNPYSNYPVLAAALTIDGRIYSGANVENANYTLTKHAEENAICAALRDGVVERCGRKWLKGLYLTSPNAKAPCGGCRQFMAEFIADDGFWVGEASADGTICSGQFAEILPLGFGPTSLGID